MGRRGEEGEGRKKMYEVFEVVCIVLHTVDISRLKCSS